MHMLHFCGPVVTSLSVPIRGRGAMAASFVSHAMLGIIVLGTGGNVLGRLSSRERA